MEFPYKVIWTDEALKNVDMIIGYLENNWTQREVNRFLEKPQEREILFPHQPKAFPLSEKGGGYRRSVLTRQIAIYYKFEDEVVTIHSLFDSRQDPDKLTLGE